MNKQIVDVARCNSLLNVYKYYMFGTIVVGGFYETSKCTKNSTIDQMCINCINGMFYGAFIGAITPIYIALAPIILPVWIFKRYN